MNKIAYTQGFVDGLQKWAKSKPNANPAIYTDDDPSTWQEVKALKSPEIRNIAGKSVSHALGQIWDSIKNVGTNAGREAERLRNARQVARDYAANENILAQLRKRQRRLQHNVDLAISQGRLQYPDPEHELNDILGEANHNMLKNRPWYEDLRVGANKAWNDAKDYATLHPGRAAGITAGSLALAYLLYKAMKPRRKPQAQPQFMMPPPRRRQITMDID